MGVPAGRAVQRALDHAQPGGVGQHQRNDEPEWNWHQRLRNQWNFKEFDADMAFHDRLARLGHWSAFEHCAKAMTENEYDCCSIDVPRDKEHPLYLVDRSNGWCGNFRGFVQYRKMFTDENRQDSRLIKH